MFDPIGDIADFHRKYGLEYDGPPRRLPDDLRLFRVNFLGEEVDEYADATDLATELDAQIDLLYVALGTLYLQGFSRPIVEEAWRRVHEKNMQKVRATNASDSKRNSTHDVVKPPGWTPADLSDLVG